ncbi:MAG: hypothetical protein ACLQFR_25260 [Streptosporangiaceae bacterium]
MTGNLRLAASGGSHGGLTALGIVELVVIAAWVLLFAVLLRLLAVTISRRGRGQPRRAAAARRSGGRSGARPAPAGSHPAELAVLRRADPTFDEQLLLDAALTATMLMFAATSAGDDAPIRRLATESFWQTPLGRLTHTTARDRRRENAQSAADQARGRRVSRWNIPLDYQPSVPELVAVSVGPQEKVCVRVSFGQLQAVVRPGTAELAAGAAATNFPSAMISLGKGVAVTGNDGKTQGASWLAAGGRYDLAFVRPAGSRTEPTAGLADRTCTTCGATHRSELATACAHCGTERPLPWGHWRLAEATPV